MYSQLYKTTPNLSSQKLIDILFINQNDEINLENIKFQELPKLQEFQTYLSNQSKTFIIQNYLYLETLEKDLESWVCLFNNFKNYIKSIKLIFEDILIQKLS